MAISFPGFSKPNLVILVLPKCLLTWGYVKVDAAAFFLQHDDRHGESAGPVEI